MEQCTTGMCVGLRQEVGSPPLTDEGGSDRHPRRSSPTPQCLALTTLASLQSPGTAGPGAWGLGTGEEAPRRWKGSSELSGRPGWGLMLVPPKCACDFERAATLLAPARQTHARARRGGRQPPMPTQGCAAASPCSPCPCPSREVRAFRGAVSPFRVLWALVRPTGTGRHAAGGRGPARPPQGRGGGS